MMLIIRFRIALGLALSGMLLVQTAAAQQVGTYQGPGVLSRGAQGVGNRGGQQVSLRFLAGVNGIYDTGLVPLSLDSSGKLAKVNALAGASANLGAYGVHEWRRSQLGLDYTGNFLYYPKNSYYSGTQQVLKLGYTFQKSRRLSFDTQTLAGTIQNNNTNFSGSIGGGDLNTSQIFDNRYNFLQTGLQVNYLTSARTTYSMGGQGFTVRRQNRQLASVNGYSLRGSVQHLISQRTMVGATYEFSHFDYSRSFGESNISAYNLFFGRTLGRSWKLDLQAGAFQIETQGLQSVALDPGLAALLGISSGVRAFYRKTTAPSGIVTLARQFRAASLSFNYTRAFNPGNGIYLTSTSESGGINYSYTGVRKWAFSASASGTRMSSIGQDILPYRILQGSVGVTRTITDSLHFVMQTSIRNQQISQAGFRRLANQYLVGLTYSPGTVPLSLW